MKMNTAVSENGLIDFLSGPFVPGVGKVTASKIVAELGLDAINKILTDDNALSDIKGLNDLKRESIRSALANLKYPVDLLLCLYASGLSQVDIDKILSHYGTLAEKVVAYDPYEMIEDVWKFSFFSADKLGKYLGIEEDDGRRLRGALLTAVKLHAQDGHIYSTEEEAIETASRITGVGKEKFKKELENLIDDERLIKSGNGIYLPVYYRAEKDGAKKIAFLIEGNKTPDYSEESNYLKTADGYDFTDEQDKAIKTVLNNAVTIITGGPGTGKTTTVKGLIDIYKNKGKNIVMVAPTGRAAKRLADLSGEEATTIHRLLGYRQGKGYNRKRIDADILIIDEASMLEQVLFNHLLQALKPGTKIVLVGDVNQLPPIGAGDVFNDMIESHTVPVINLHYNFRQGKGSLIAENAENIRNGELPLSNVEKDFIIIEESNGKKILERLLNVVSFELPEKYGINSKAIQVVTPQSEGPLGSRQLNIDIQNVVNGEGPALFKGLKTFRVGDRVMQTSNSSSRKTYNGETGWVSCLDERERWLEVTFFDGKVSRYSYAELGELSLAYAVTVHKLQGSETDYVVMILATIHRRLLYRNLFYTAVSRAKKLCVVICDPKALRATLDNAILNSRNSYFKQRLQKYIQPNSSNNFLPNESAE